MEIKHAFFKELSEAAKPEAILCTNTSGMSITEIAKAVKDPSRFCGMHWVNPPHLIPLVEVIAGEQSSEEVLQVVYDVAESLHQKPVRVYKDPTGFILNRLQYACLREACHCVEMGYASLEDVDKVMKYGLGMRYSCIGPFETVDFGGIHIFNHVGSYMFDALCNDGGIDVANAEALFAHNFSDAGCQLHTVCTAIGFIRIGKMATDIPFSNSAEHGIHQGVQKNVGIRMSKQAHDVRNFHTAEDQIAPLH